MHSATVEIDALLNDHDYEDRRNCDTGRCGRARRRIGADLSSETRDRRGGEDKASGNSGLMRPTPLSYRPGGESTTIGRLMEREGIFPEIKEAAEEGKPILGTCAGMVLLAKEGDEEVAKTGQPLLGLMDVKVKRNAFGRQRESFEVLLKMSIFEETFHAVFIRAPAITQAAENVEILATFDEHVVAAKQGNIIALSFHPELTEDRRFHHYFIDLCK